jgi:hypothetical protein
VPLCPAILDRDSAALDPAEFVQPLHKSGGPRSPGRCGGCTQVADGRQLSRLLRTRRQRPRDGRSAWKALGVIGPSRSVIKTCGDAPCSRCRRRRARISSPCNGWTLGEPFLALRTCSRPALSATFQIGTRFMHPTNARAGLHSEEPRDELAPLHSITSSARASSVGGTVRSRALAVLRLMTTSYLVGACTGRSAGFSPLRIRSM